MALADRAILGRKSAHSFPMLPDMEKPNQKHENNIQFSKLNTSILQECR